MKFNIPDIGAVLVLIATLAGIYYAGYRAGGNAINLSDLNKKHADLIRFTESQQDINERYDLVLQEIYPKEAADKTPVPPVLARVIERLPDPVK
jgi:hypothetical protein